MFNFKGILFVFFFFEFPRTRIKDVLKEHFQWLSENMYIMVRFFERFI